jgi:quercetin dioxygenase-like cupin family protein
LRSLWERTSLKQEAGYEWVRIRGLVPRHNHRAKNPKRTGSFAIVFVISGEGQFGFATDDGPGEVAAIGAGSVVIAGPNDWHGFFVERWKQVTIISIQIDVPIGKELYEFASGLGIPEFPYR